MNDSLQRYRNTVLQLVRRAKKLFEPKSLIVQSQPSDFVHESVPFPQLSICKVCQLEPVSNFFGICRTCRIAENTKRKVVPIGIRYRFR